MQLDELPLPLQEWLNEEESYGATRYMRLHEEMTIFGPNRMLDWFLVAFTLGQENAASKETSASTRDNDV